MLGLGLLIFMIKNAFGTKKLAYTFEKILQLERDANSELRFAHLFPE